MPTLPLARFSLTKIVALATTLLMLAILPNLPDFGRGLTSTAFFYTAWGSSVRLGATVVLAGLAFIFTGLAIEASIWPVAIWIDEGELKWRAFGQKVIKLTNISDVKLDTRARLIRVTRLDGKHAITWSTVTLRSMDARGPLITRLKAAIP